MPQIIVDKNKCNKCNTCATVCVMGIIENGTETSMPLISDEKLDYCIKCGHCESFCPQKALALDFLLEEKIDTTTHDGNIKPEILSLYIKKRRSIRHFSSKPVDKNLLV